MNKDSPRTVPVLVPTPVDRPFSYAVPDGEEVPPEILIPSALYYREDAEQDPALKQPSPK